MKVFSRSLPGLSPSSFSPPARRRPSPRATSTSAKGSSALIASSCAISPPAPQRRHQPPSAARHRRRRTRRRGAQVATEPVADIRNLGLPAVLAQGQPAPRDGDIVITGYFTSVEEGSARQALAARLRLGSRQTRDARRRLPNYVNFGVPAQTAKIKPGRHAGSRSPESCPKRDQLPVRG
jgi:hypothetical protein